MKFATPFIVALMLGAFSLSAQARDDRLKFPIADAMSGVQEQLGDTVHFYFSGQNAPSEKHSYGTFTSNKKTNFFNKTDKAGCERAFASAMLSLRDRAQKEGGDAVIDIHSVYKNVDFKSATEYECGAGSIMGGVALRGTVVKLH